MQEIYSSNPPVVTGICDPKISRNKHPTRFFNWHKVGGGGGVVKPKLNKFKQAGKGDSNIGHFMRI